MSYAIIRNTKYTIANLNGIYRHNERKNTNYSNEYIDKKKSINNYSLKKCNMPYSKAFKEIRKEKNLQGWIKKNSNVACEYIITSDKDFFDNLGKEETKRFFKTSYEFVKNYKNLGEEYILSAKVHLDETTPHMHLIFIPVIHKYDKEREERIDKISCTEFWKGKNSYKILQDNFYDYMVKAGFELERGMTKDNKHIPIEDLKKITNNEFQEMLKNTKYIKKEIGTSNIRELKENYEKVLEKFNILVNRYYKIKQVIDNTMKRVEEVNAENIKLQQEKIELEREIKYLKKFLNNTFEYTSILFDFPKDRLERLVKEFVEKFK